VSEIPEDEAIQLAQEYQPERRIKKFDINTRKEEEIVIPKCDLKAFLG